MINQYTTGIDDRMFDYDLFKKDLDNFCTKNKTSIQEISEDVLHRNKDFLSNKIRNHKLPIALASVISRHIGSSLTKYKIIEQPSLFDRDNDAVKDGGPLITSLAEYEDTKESSSWPDVKNIVSQPLPESKDSKSSIWKIDLVVKETLYIVSSIISKDGKVLGTGPATLKATSEAEIIEGIRVSVSAACDKALMELSGGPKSGATIDEVIDKSSGKVSGKPFKDWIMQYYNDHSDVGRLARFIDCHYDHFPSWGADKMRKTLMLTKGGSAHVQTFNAFFDRYRALDRAEERANSMDSLKRR